MPSSLHLKVAFKHYFSSFNSQATLPSINPVACMDVHNGLLLAKVCVSLNVNALCCQNVFTSGWFLSHISRILFRQYNATQCNPYFPIEVSELPFRNQGTHSN